LTYACQRLMTARTPAREFPRSMISKNPFANEVAPPKEEFKRLQAGEFRDWRLVVDGTVAQADVAVARRFEAACRFRAKITEVACEEGWSYIAEWIGTPLSGVLREAGVLPQSRYVVYYAIEKGLWESIDMADAMHPHTFLTMGMNDGDLPVPFGGPLRLRVPRQLGYKSLKYLTHITVTDDIKKFGSGKGSADPDYGYSWYAGI
jgi:DMSO/TMAO reductase YedYZ molybdopterin-dependent catalytic subunit